MPIKLSNDLTIDNTNRMILDYRTLYLKLNTARKYGDYYVVNYAKIGDNIYSNLTGTFFNKIKSITDDTLIDDNNVEYPRDTAFIGSFQFIPEEAETKTITIQELLEKLD